MTFIANGITQRQAELDAAEHGLKEAQAALREANDACCNIKGEVAVAAAARIKWIERARAAAQAKAKAVREGLEPRIWGDWNSPNWESVDFSAPCLPKAIRVGTDGRGVPVAVNLLSSNKTIVIKALPPQADQARALMQNMVLRIALALPHQSRFTFIDPAKLGRSFPMQSALPAVRPQDPFIAQPLQAVVNEIQRINRDVLKHAESFEALSPDVWVSERFEFVFVADFGSKNTVSSQVFDRMADIATGGQAAGRYLIVYLNADAELPKDIDLDRLGPLEVIDLTSTGLKLDPVPEPAWQESMLARARAAKPPERTTSFQDVVGADPTSGWTWVADEMIEAPVGEGIRVWLGDDRQTGRNCAHGALAGTTGSGKSSFLHAMIAGLATRYAPNDLRLYLIDGKSGVEFSRYRTLPHAEVVSLRTAPIFALSVIRDLHEEMEHRFALFNSAGAQNLTDYRRGGNALPRILLIVDEYQQLFEADQAAASDLVLRLSQKGRAAGIHLFLASQRFVAQGMLQADKIFNNIELRIALKLNDAAGLVEFGPKGKQMIKEIDRSGVAVVNDVGGEDSGNRRGVVLNMTKAESEAMIETLARRAAATPGLEDCRPVVFTGEDQPALLESGTFASLLAEPAWRAPAEIEELARRSARADGFGEEHWLAAEHPRAFFLGRQFAVRGDEILALRRSIHENALLIGTQSVPRMGMLVGGLISSAALHRPGSVTLRLLDAVPPGAPGSGALQAVTAGLLAPLGIDATVETDPERAPDLVAALADEVADRRAGGALDRPSLVAVLTDLDRSGGMFRDPSGRGGIYEKFRAVLKDGPQVGVHVLLSLSSIRLFGQILDERRDLQYFNHRISLQTSDADSRMLLSSAAASDLAKIGSGIAAVHARMMLGASGLSWFKPYDKADPDAIAAECATVLARLRERFQ